MHRRATLAAALVAALGMAAAAPAATAASAAAAGPSVVLVGHGWGHGRGLSQWGSYGYAVDQGWTSSRILDHYYGGTRSGSIPTTSPISVRLMSPADASTTWITSTKDFTVGGVKVGAGSSARIFKSGTAWKMYTSYGSCPTSPGNFGPFAVADTSIKLVPQAGTTAADTLVVCGTGRGYRGSLTLAEFVSGGVTTRNLVNTLPMEEYLRGVVPRESPASWGDARGGLGMAALEAQAVAARSYAWSENRYSSAKTCDTTSCQVYGGATLNGTPLSDPRSDAAVSNTAGIVRVLTSSGAVARTEFSASTGGWTTGTAFTNVEDRGDSRSPTHDWTVRLDGAQLASHYGVGTFKQLLIVAQDPHGTAGGRAQMVRIVGSTAGKDVSKDITAASFRDTWGLNSDWFFVVDQPIRQVTSLGFVKLAYSDRVYRQFGFSPNKWQSHAYVSAAEYAASGRPAVTTIGSVYVKYPWSPTVYAVTYWPQDEYWQWDQLSDSQLASVGNPTPRIAGFIYGTVYYKNGTDPAVYAQAPDDTVHHLTYAEWQAAGYPQPTVR